MTKESSSDEAIAVPERLQAILVQLPRRGRSGASLIDKDGSWRIRLEPTTEPLSLASLSDGDTLVIDVDLSRASSRAKIKINCLPDGSTVVMQVPSGNRQCSAEIEGLNGTLGLTVNGSPLTIRVEGAPSGTLRLGSGEFVLTVVEGSGVHVVASEGAEVALANSVPRLLIEGNCALRGPQASIETLRVGPNAHMAVGAGGVSADVLESDGVARDLRITGSRSAGESASRTVVVKTKSAIGVTLHLDGPLPPSVIVAEEIRQVTVNGSGALQLAHHSYAEGLEGDGGIRLTARPGAVATDLSGTWIIELAAEAHLRGGASGFDIASITQPTRNTGSPVNGAVLIGFRFSDRRSRRRALAVVVDAYHLNPDTSGLPGGGKQYHERRPWRSRLGHEQQLNLAEDSEFVGELARLARSKGAPGSTRTRIAWCSYRLRHLSTSGFWERMLLTGYRFLGYGERPGPAFLTWLSLAAIGAGVVLGPNFDFSVAGIATYLKEAMEQALSPIGALFRTGTPEASPLEYVLRALVAIPLITGGLALRNYVKQEGR